MNDFPAAFAFAAICATSIAVTAKTVPPRQVTGRTQIIPLPEPISLCIDELALIQNRGNEFQESLIPEAIKKLNGKRVRIVGRMHPRISSNPNEQVKYFVFNGYSQRDTDPLEEFTVQHFISVSMQNDTKTTYSAKDIEIEGQLIIRPEFNSGELRLLYHIQDAVVRPGERPSGFHQPGWILPFYSC